MPLPLKKPNRSISTPRLRINSRICSDFTHVGGLNSFSKLKDARKLDSLLIHQGFDSERGIAFGAVIDEDIRSPIFHYCFLNQAHCIPSHLRELPHNLVVGPCSLSWLIATL